MKIPRAQALAFRLEGHSLHRRQPADALIEAARACGIRNTPPGSAILALNARLEGVQADTLDQAIESKALVEVLGPRCSPWIVPADDLESFTIGALPRDERSLRSVLVSHAPTLDSAGLTASEALKLTVESARSALADGPLERGALSAAMTAQLPDSLAVQCRPCRSRHVQESLFRLAGVAGAFLLAPRRGRSQICIRPDHWLGARDAPDPVAARAELLRRYLRCYGPSSAEHFAQWVGMGAVEARQDWDAIRDQLVSVDLDGRRAWLHHDDLDRLEQAQAPRGVRLLPPYDAYLDQRDRATLLPDRSLHGRLWRILGNPGAVLVDGEVIALWRSTRRGAHLIMRIEELTPISSRAKALIEAECASQAPLRDCAKTELTFAA